jgi:hypothetical protein
MNADSGEIIAVKEIEILKLSYPGEQERQKKRFELLRAECHKLEGFCYETLVQYIGFDEAPAISRMSVCPDSRTLFIN